MLAKKETTKTFTDRRSQVVKVSFFIAIYLFASSAWSCIDNMSFAYRSTDGQYPWCLIQLSSAYSKHSCMIASMFSSVWS